MAPQIGQHVNSVEMSFHLTLTYSPGFVGNKMSLATRCNTKMQHIFMSPAEIQTADPG